MKSVIAICKGSKCRDEQTIYLAGGEFAPGKNGHLTLDGPIVDMANSHFLETRDDVQHGVFDIHTVDGKIGRVLATESGLSTVYRRK